VVVSSLTYSGGRAREERGARRPLRSVPAWAVTGHARGARAMVREIIGARCRIAPTEAQRSGR